MRIAERLANKGWTALLFDYRGSGYSTMNFEDMTIQTEIEDLHHILDFCRDRALSTSLSIWAMSLGTSVAIEVLRHRDPKEVKAAVLWGLSADLHARWSTRWEDQFAEKGYAILPSGFLVRPSVVEGMRGVDTYASLDALTIPCLLVAGGAASEEVAMSRRAMKTAGNHCDLIEVANGNHGFKGQPDLFDAAYQRSVAWLERHVSQGDPQCYP